MKEKKFWRLSPHIPVKDVQETVEWYKQNLDFSKEWYYGDPVTDGGCSRDELRVLFGKSPEPIQAIKDISMIIFVTNVEAVYEEIQQKNLPILHSLKTRDYGIKEFAIKDINGYMLRFAESV